MSRVAAKPYFVYILWSETGGRFYIGISDDPSRRLAQHNLGLFSAWTTRYRPWTLVHQEQYESYRTARRREIELKQQKGGRGFYELTGLDPERFQSRTHKKGS